MLTNKMTYLSITSIITPFDYKNEIDQSLFLKLLDRQVDFGATGIHVASKIGEGNFLDLHEKILLINLTQNHLGNNISCFVSLDTKDFENREVFEKLKYEESLTAVINYRTFDLNILKKTPTQIKKIILIVENHNEFKEAQKLLCFPCISQIQCELSYQETRAFKDYRGGAFYTSDNELSPFLANHSLGLFSSVANLYPALWHPFAISILENKQIVDLITLRKFVPYMKLKKHLLLEQTKKELAQMGLCLNNKRGVGRILF